MTPALEEIITLPILTANTAGTPTNADSTPTVVVWGGGTALALNPTVTNRATGYYTVAIPCTAANGFEAGKSYTAIATVTISAVPYLGDLGDWQMRTGSVDAVNVTKWGTVAVTGMPMPTYTQPTGFLLTTFAGTVGTSTLSTSDLSTLATAANLATANASLVKIQAADYDTATVSGNVVTLSNGATQTVTSSGRITA